MEIHISIDKLVVHISSYLEYFTNTISYSACVGVSMYIFPFASKDVGKSLSGNPTVASCTNIARGRDIEGRQIPLPVKPLEGDLPLPIHSSKPKFDDSMNYCGLRHSHHPSSILTYVFTFQKLIPLFLSIAHYPVIPTQLTARPLELSVNPPTQKNFSTA